MEGLPIRFGKYTLIRKLATGGMAELFLALQKSVAGFEKLLVIKRILPAMNQDQAFITMLLHEARIAATLSHPNIVQIFDVGQVDNNYYIAMEHVHGEDLRSIVRQMKKKAVNEFPVEHAIAIVLGMCAGLTYAHEKRDLDGTPLNIVHRDISPQNVVVTFTGDVKIVDFGIAKSDTKMVTETKSGRLKGKIPYMSPEQARGDGVDWRSDIFATGVMLFELTTGKRLFKGASEFETLKLICEREYPRPSQVRPGYPTELERIVMKALAKDRNERFQSAREMQVALEAFVRHERMPVSNIALNQFMQALFEDKLAVQKEALLQGKQLADIIASQPPPESTAELDAMRNSGSILSMPAASRTVTGVPSPEHRSKRGGAVVAMLGIAGLVGAGLAVGGWFVWKKGRVVDHAVSATQAPSAAATSLARGAVAIVSEPPGASIWVNGEARAETTPATLNKLDLGAPMDIKIGKDGYEDEIRTVTLTESEPSSAFSVTLKKATCSIEVTLKPSLPAPGLIVDGKVQQGLVADGLSAGGDGHRIVVYANGYRAQQLNYTCTGSEKKHFDVALRKLDPSEKDKTPDPAAAATAAPTTTSTAASGGTGKIYVGAHGGWCNVTIDGASYGPTPVAGISVSAGNHSVSCTTPAGKTLGGGVNVPADGAGRISFPIPQ